MPYDLYLEKKEEYDIDTIEICDKLDPKTCYGLELTLNEPRKTPWLILFLMRSVRILLSVSMQGKEKHLRPYLP